MIKEAVEGCQSVVRGPDLAFVVRSSLSPLLHTVSGYGSDAVDLHPRCSLYRLQAGPKGPYGPLFERSYQMWVYFPK